MPDNEAVARWIPDNSALKAFRESPEVFRLQYRLHLHHAGPNDKMLAGSAVHAGRNVLYEWRRTAQAAETLTGTPWTAGYPEEIVAEAVRVTRAHRGEGSGPRNADQCEQVIRTYAAKYAVEPFAVVENERYVEARIHSAQCLREHDATVCGPMVGDICGADCFDFCGIQDAVIRFPDGSEYVKDLKSTGAYLNAGWEVAARLGDQFVGYVAMRRALGYRCDGFFVDGIHMKDAKPRKDGSIGTPGVDPDDFVRVGPVAVPDWRVERWAADVRYTLKAIRELDETRGPDVPWPAYQNWAFGKVDQFREFYEVPPELYPSVANTFERREWSPRAVADERAVT